MRAGALALGALALLASQAAAEPVYIDPELAAEDPDFHVQGEYAADGLGAQIIARGDHSFEGFLLPGGLPGAGWTGEGRQHFSGQTDGEDITRFEGHGLELAIEDGTLTVRYDNGAMKARLPRVERVSATKRLEAPDSAIILFDGPDDAENWENGRVDDRGLLMQGVTSKQSFGDHHIHVEFLIPFRPHARGQGRGNSGIYVQSRYEVQMLDSFGDEPHHSHNGGIYSVAEAELNMSYPPLRWQTYDIEFTAARFDDEGNKTEDARMTVYHNGVKVHDDVAVPHTTTASPIGNESAEPGPINLQDHGNPVRYRNVWVVEK